MQISTSDVLHLTQFLEYFACPNQLDKGLTDQDLANFCLEFPENRNFW